MISGELAPRLFPIPRSQTADGTVAGMCPTTPPRGGVRLCPCAPPTGVQTRTARGRLRTANGDPPAQTRGLRGELQCSSSLRPASLSDTGITSLSFGAAIPVSP